jgi:hypothetical protein
MKDLKGEVSADVAPSMNRRGWPGAWAACAVRLGAGLPLSWAT